MQVCVENLVYNVHFKNILVGIILASFFISFGIYRNLEVGSDPYMDRIHDPGFKYGRNTDWRGSDLGRRCCEGFGPRSPLFFIFYFFLCYVFRASIFVEPADRLLRLEVADLSGGAIQGFFFSQKLRIVLCLSVAVMLQSCNDCGTSLCE